MEIFLYKSFGSTIHKHDLTKIFHMYIYSQHVEISVFFLISVDFLFPQCPTYFLYKFLNLVKFLYILKHVRLIIYYILCKKYIVLHMQYS